jgi:ABC-type multidrug transport system ATPase subunit
LELVSGLYGLRVDQEGLLQALDRVGLARSKDRIVRQFSRGMTQRLALARLMLVDPAVWLLDEPASGLDDVGRDWLQDEITQLKARGRIIAIASHSRHLVGSLATHAVVLRKGRVAYAGAVEDSAHVDRLFAESIG